MGTNITDELSKTFAPQAALLVFRSPNNCCNDSYYLEVRPIKSDGTFGTARPVTKKFMNTIASSYKSENEITPHGIMPQNMLYADSRMGEEKYVWWTPPQKRQMYFSENIALDDGEYYMPGTIYVVEKQNLSVYAFKGKRPNGKTQLLKGPFFNYYEDCSMCLGNAKAEWPKNIRWQDIQAHWEKLFWGSINSHSTCNPMIEGKNLVLAIKDAKDKPFNTDLLRKANRILDSILK